MVWRVTLDKKVVPLSLTSKEHPVHLLPSIGKIIVKPEGERTFNASFAHPDRDVEFHIRAVRWGDTVEFAVGIVPKNKTQKFSWHQARNPHLKYARVILGSVYNNSRFLTKVESTIHSHALPGREPMDETILQPTSDTKALREVLAKFVDNLELPKGASKVARNNLEALKKIVKERPARFD